MTRKSIAWLRFDENAMIKKKTTILCHNQENILISLHSSATSTEYLELPQLEYKAGSLHIKINNKFYGIYLCTLDTKYLKVVYLWKKNKVVIHY